MGEVLRRGTHWVSAESRDVTMEWELTGRELYVLGINHEHRGFVHQARLVVGQQHVVLCSSKMLNDVLETIAKVGSPSPEIFNEPQGLPTDWVALRGVVPSIGLEQEDSAGILNVLYPFPEVDINFEGGIRIDRSTWLFGFPPTIRLSGNFDEVDDIRVDGYSVVPAEDGILLETGWDEIGDHRVFCGGKTSTYSISRGQESWERWDAHRIWTGIRGDRVDNCLGICGTLVSEAADADYGVTFTAENPILLGRQPGEVYECTRSPDVSGVPYVGFPPFLPVWSFPKDIDSGNKTAMKVVLLNLYPPNMNFRFRRRMRRPHDDPTLRWVSLIRQAYQRGLLIQGDFPEANNLWRQYKRSAKYLWKLFR